MIFRNAFLRTGLAILTIVWLGAAAFGQQSTVREEKVMMKTYPFSDPDPMPYIGPIYPYFRYHGYSLTGRNQEWKMVALENPYVKVLVAPEIGGKVWGAVEKSAGREFIYWNKVVKFREIALRGPWTSGGIEFNFGIIGHTPTTATPVDYLIKENPDGSASCIIGAIDLPSRTYWRVNIRVPRDAAYLETECFWFNPTVLHDSLYHWMTGAEDVADDLKYYYPGTHAIGHGGQVSPWPVQENGRDVSYYRNNNFGSHKSYHILGEYGEFFSGYFEESGYGYGHWALHDDKPGMKLWIWSLGRDGEIWTDLLSEGKKYNYTEPQTGLLYNQAGGDSGLTPFKHAYFAPQSVLRWKEIWFPVKDIGGLVAASPYAALNVSRDGGNVRLGLCPLQKIDDDLVIKLDGKEVLRKHLTLIPLETYSQEIDISSRAGEVTVELGGEKLRWASGDKKRNRLGRPIVAPESFDWTSAEGLYVAGEELARQRSYIEALAKFQACLEKEPGHVRALTRAAELCFKRSESDRALEYARLALAIDTYDAGANFIYGVINRDLGRLPDAKDGFGWAARSLEFRSAAYEQLAEISLIEKNPSRAAEYSRRALDYNRYNLEAHQIQAIVARLEQETEAAAKTLEAILDIDPLSHFARFERFLFDSRPDHQAAFLSFIRNELPYQTYLELAMTYFNLGRTEEAVVVLELSPQHSIVDYWLAYLNKEVDPERSRKFLQRALATRPDLVFPFRREILPVLRWAGSQLEDWKTTYFLALLLWNQGNNEEAGTLFAALGDRPDWSPFYLARCRFFGNKRNREHTLADIRRAVDLDPKNWRARRTLTEFYDRNGKFDLALESARAVHKLYPDKSALAMDVAKMLLRTGNHEECLKVLERTTVLPYEGAWEGHDLYRQANLFLAADALGRSNPRLAASLVEKAKLWPEHLGVGRPFETDERLENSLLAAAYKKMNDPKKAQDLYERIAAETEKYGKTHDSILLVSVISLKKLGKENEAIRLLREWEKAGGADKPVYSWAAAKFSGDAKRAADVLTKLRAAPSGASWDLGTGDRYLPLVLNIAERIEK